MHQSQPYRSGGKVWQNSPPLPQPALPSGYLKNGYFDQKGNVLDDMIVTWPKELAIAFHQAKPQLKTAQLRNFFGEVRRQQSRLISGVPFEKMRVEILKLDAYAQNAVKKNNAPQLFSTFMTANSKRAAESQEAFQAFVYHFESIVGYYPETK